MSYNDDWSQLPTLNAQSDLDEPDMAWEDSWSLPVRERGTSTHEGHDTCAEAAVDHDWACDAINQSEPVPNDNLWKTSDVTDAQHYDTFLRSNGRNSAMVTSTTQHKPFQYLSAGSIQGNAVCPPQLSTSQPV